MTDLPTLEAALKLADQDSPLPSLAGPALKVLRDHVQAMSRALPQPLSAVALNKLEHLRRRGAREFGVAVTTDHDCMVACVSPLGRVEWFNCRRDRVRRGNEDSATLTALIAELRAREAVGRQKYGTDVDRTDLTNTQWRQHLREELMDALLYSLAEERTVAPVYGIDRGVDDRTVEAFGHRDDNGAVTFTQFLESDPSGPNSGHGHVRKRPDGLVAKCGGPMMCRICAKELADMLEVPGDDKCWCSTCRPITATALRMVVCPTCGNKRCPHAHDHRNACTGSNAVGQPGSSWGHVKPITPPAPKDC